MSVKQLIQARIMVANALFGTAVTSINASSDGGNGIKRACSAAIREFEAQGFRTRARYTAPNVLSIGKGRIEFRTSKPVRIIF